MTANQQARLCRKLAHQPLLRSHKGGRSRSEAGIDEDLRALVLEASLARASHPLETRIEQAADADDA